MREELSCLSGSKVGAGRRGGQQLPGRRRAVGGAGDAGDQAGDGLQTGPAADPGGPAQHPTRRWVGEEAAAGHSVSQAVFCLLQPCLQLPRVRDRLPTPVLSLHVDGGEEEAERTGGPGGGSRGHGRLSARLHASPSLPCIVPHATIFCLYLIFSFYTGAVTVSADSSIYSVAGNSLRSTWPPCATQSLKLPR